MRHFGAEKRPAGEVQSEGETGEFLEVDPQVSAKLGAKGLLGEHFVPKVKGWAWALTERRFFLQGPMEEESKPSLG